MNNKPTGTRIVFLSANAGTGHDMAAKAVIMSISEISSGVSTEIVNSYQFIQQPYRTLMEKGYVPFITFFPSLYRYLYERKHKQGSILKLKSWLNRSTVANFRRYLEEVNPHLIICTHAYPCGVLAELKRRGELRTKVVGIVTDYVVNPFWIYPETDLYLTASNELREFFVKTGISPDRVCTTGIPVDPRFDCQPRDKDLLRSKLQLEADFPTILIMGGGLGMNPAAKSFAVLKQMRTPVQAVIIMGHNERGRKILEREAAGFHNEKVKIRILSYIDNVFEYMKAADLLVTKPGGMTITEASAAGLPMVLTDPLPGQENNNVQYLLKQGVAVVADSEKDLVRTVSRLIQDRDTLREMSQRTLRFSVPDSSAKAAEKICSLLNLP